MTTVLILGLGEFGSNIAKRMSEFKCEVMAVDIKEERVDDILPFVGSARIGDSTNEEFLRSLGVNSYDVCIVALGGLFQSSLETTNLLKELGAPFVVSRATNDVQMKFLKMSGADEVVYPEKQTAIRLATKYASESILDFIPIFDLSIKPFLGRLFLITVPFFCLTLVKMTPSDTTFLISSHP